jgi:hypothetical protein
MTALMISFSSKPTTAQGCIVGSNFGVAYFISFSVLFLNDNSLPNETQKRVLEYYKLDPTSTAIKENKLTLDLEKLQKSQLATEE